MLYCPDSYLNKLLQIGTLTGSRAFNCATKNSDWDIVLTKKEYNSSLLNDYPLDLKYTAAHIISRVDFTESKVHNTLNIEEIDEDKIIYDQITIWGPIEQIVKFKLFESNEPINFFIYPAKFSPIILEKFQEVTHLMNFLYGDKLQDRQYRIEAFKKVLKSVGITDLS